MPQRIRVKLNSAGVRALLRSSGVQADLRSRAQRIAARAGDGHTVHTSQSAQRARAEVVTESFEAMMLEARDRNLTRAIGAGR